MPGQGRAAERAYAPDERAALGGTLAALGDTTFDIYLNEDAFWCNVPAAVWNYRLGGYQVLKKWLSYRERDILDRTLKPEEVQPLCQYRAADRGDFGAGKGGVGQMKENARCPIWGTPATECRTRGGDRRAIDSPRAGGRYFISGSAETIVGSREVSLKARLTTMVDRPAAARRRAPGSELRHDQGKPRHAARCPFGNEPNRYLRLPREALSRIQAFSIPVFNPPRPVARISLRRFPGWNPQWIRQTRMVRRGRWTSLTTISSNRDG